MGAVVVVAAAAVVVTDSCGGRYTTGSGETRRHRANGDYPEHVHYHCAPMETR